MVRRTMRRLIQYVALCAALGAAAANHEPVENGGEWITLDKGVEFQPNEGPEAAASPRLRQAQHRFLAAANKSPYVSQDAYYSGYAQAWRLLGFYVECDESGQQDGGNNNHRTRQLNEYEMVTCQRYLLWAAYVDLDYGGNGIGEYQFWDPDRRQWDSSTCDQGNSRRCARMDCHLPDSSTWSLLGVYKEAFYASQWFEQLFKHAGYCIWSSELYEWMEEQLYNWPEGCQNTDATDESGNSLYLDLKPSAGGNLTLALYTDAICKTEYGGDYVSVDNVAANKGYLTGADLQKFNDAMEVYKYCNSCRANDRRREEEGGPEDGPHRALGQGMDDDQYDPNDGRWKCSDAAGYTNVNQCMKFRTHTYFQAASIYDLHTAATQGGMLEIVLGQQSYGTEWRPGRGDDAVESVARQATASVSRAAPETGKILIISGSILLAIGFVVLGAALRWLRKRRKRYLQVVHLSEPLMQ